MIIYKDRISGDELFSDIYPMETFSDVLWKVKGKLVSESAGVDESNFGFNKSADGQDEGEGADASNAVSGINVVLANRLTTTSFDKKAYVTYIKKYMKDLKAKMEGDGADAAAVEKFMADAQGAVKKIVGRFKEYEFYLGESFNCDGMVVLADWEGETPYLYFFKDGLIEEKV